MPPGMARRPWLLHCLPAWSSFLLGKIHPGKGEPGAILQHNLERSSRAGEGYFGCKPTSSASSHGSLLLACTLTITTSPATTSQTQLASIVPSCKTWERKEF